MAQTKKRVANTIASRAHDKIIEARFVLKAMGFKDSMTLEELAVTFATLAFEANDLKCHREVISFFQSVTSSAETTLVQNLLNRTRKSKLYKDNSRDGARMRSALRKEHQLKAKIKRGWDGMNKTEEDFAKRRDTLDSFRGIIAQVQADTKQRTAKQQQSQSQSILKHRGRQDEKAIKNALKVLIAMNPTADPTVLEKKIRETMKPT